MSIDDINNQNIIDVDYDEVENVLYLSAPQLAKKIGTTEATIRSWAEVYGDLIGIEKINGRKTYKETQVTSFAFIKDLVDNKNMKKTQVRNYISKHGFKYAEYDSGLIDPKDPLGFEALASSLTVQVTHKLNIFTQELMANVTNQLNEHLNKQYQSNIENKAEIEASVSDILDAKLLNLAENQEQLKEFVAITIQNEVKENLNNQMTEFKSAIDTIEQTNTKYILEKEELMKQHMLEKQNIQKLIEAIQSQQKSQSWLKRLFGKKIDIGEGIFPHLK